MYIIMKDKMKKKEIEKIEEKLSDKQISDSVLNLARAEMLAEKREKTPKSRKFNLKIVLLYAASFVLCLAIILPITITSIKNPPIGDSAEPPSTGGLPEEDDSVTDPSAPYYILENLDKEIINIGEGPSAPMEEEIEYVAHYKYFDGEMAIISEVKYTVNGTECTVYTLYDTAFIVDVLEEFKGFTSFYQADNAKVNYKINNSVYFADAVFKDLRYCFTGNFSAKTDFEIFCDYLFK